jgi:hypothetical protein
MGYRHWKAIKGNKKTKSLKQNTKYIANYKEEWNTAEEKVKWAHEEPWYKFVSSIENDILRETMTYKVMKCIYTLKRSKVKGKVPPCFF